VSPPEHDALISAALNQITVVVVTHHSAHCVPWLAQTLRSCPHVVVVDNASDDDTVALVRQQLPQAHVIALPDNLGFGAANNRGLAWACAHAHTPYALLLNPDCSLSPEAMAQLVRTAHAWPQAAIVAPQLCDSQGQPQLNYGWPRWRGTSRGLGAQGLLAVGYACGAAWLLRLSPDAVAGTALPQGGERGWWFDEAFFLYYEDEDLCARIFKSGQLVLIDPQAQARHANRGSVRGRSVLASEWRRGYHHSRSKVLFWARHVGWAQAQRVHRQALWTGALELLLRLLTLHPRLIARSAGRWAGMCSLWGMTAPTESDRSSASSPASH
jgi:GT2 family glycosyltransferase